MPSNPLTQEEINQYVLDKILNPPGYTGLEAYLPSGYFLSTPSSSNGPALWRLFDGSFIRTGLVSVDRLGSGAVGSGNLYLADNNTWKAISTATPTLQQVTTAGNTTTDAINVSGFLSAKGSVNLNNEASTTNFNKAYYIFNDGTNSYGLTLTYNTGTYLSTLYATSSRRVSLAISSVQNPSLQSHFQHGLTLTENLNILINTQTDSGYRLDVNGTVRFQDSLLFSSTKGVYASSALTTVLQGATNYFTHNRVSGSGTHGFQLAQVGTSVSFWRWNDSNGNTEFGAGGLYGLQLFTNNSARVTIDLAGNIGVGTSSPLQKFHVEGSVRFGSGLIWDNSNGRLGIGNLSPSYTLDVSGTTRLGGNVTVGGIIDTSATYTTCGLLGSINVGTNSTAIIGFTAKLDPNGWWNPSTKRWTPTISGYYNVTLQVRWDIGTLGNQINIQILKNTATQAICQDLLPTNTGLTQTTNCIVYMNGSSDYLEFSGYSSSTTGENIFGEGNGTWTFFNAYRIN